MRRTEKVAVLGAGTMGARIAAHLANAGVASFLLDIVPPEADSHSRNRIAQAGLDAARKSKPPAFFEPSLAGLITVGNFEDDLGRIAEADWILEAVVEDIQVKRSLLKKVEAVRRPGTIVTTNTSGLPVARIAEGFGDDFRRHWFGTHFFNPPRYMRLLEIIPTPETDRAALDLIVNFCDLRLGKGIVFAKDTPNFIANRIGAFSVLNIMRLMQQMDLSIEEVDALTGTAIGWPKSATFRTIDMVGLDVLAQVAGNMQSLRNERSDLALPGFVRHMLERKWLGDKSGGGFYKKIQTGGHEEHLALDWKTLEYRPRQKVKFPVLEMTKNVESMPQRLRMLLGLDGVPQNNDVVCQFLWTALSDLWIYSANRVAEICDSVAEIDRAMRLGFNWELGPFELWDAAGVEPTLKRMQQEGKPLAKNAERLLASGQKSWYADAPNASSGLACFDLATGGYENVRLPAGVWSVLAAKKSNGVVKKNPGASLVDLGEGVGCIEFHSKMNTIGGDIVQFITDVLKPRGADANFDSFVITNDAQHFCAGANLMLLLLAIQEQDWDEIDHMVRAFQQMTWAIKFSPRPVVVAPFGMTLGGGCEVALHGAARQPHCELYMGFAEAGVGLLPAGGGCKEMLLRAIDGYPTLTLSETKGNGGGVHSQTPELLEAIKHAFETIALAKVSTSAADARHLSLLSEADQVTMNRERLLSDAKARALELSRTGYKPPLPRAHIPAPGESILAALKLGVHLMREGDFITAHDARIGNKIAEVLCGGALTPGTAVSEQYILDLEREAFKSLCGERNTQERIQYTLKAGKPLRN
ncbi:MAG: 3-hydroxyacyl-CoA dehydrogenase NAD-binding domain-containing protein [Terriglobales bacterium]